MDHLKLLATSYILHVRLLHPLAASELATLQACYGDYIAYWAAFAVLHLRRHMYKTKQLPVPGEYEHYLQGCREALPYLQRVLEAVLSNIKMMEPHHHI
jgi:hypothetical protein